MQESEGKSRPVTDEELAAQHYLFEAAYNDIKAGQSRKGRIQRLAKELEDIGYIKVRICRAIVRKLTFPPLKITTDDYVRRVLGEEYKDYSQLKVKPTIKAKPAQPKEKPKIMVTKYKDKVQDVDDDKLDIEKTKQDDKEITTVYLKKPQKKAQVKTHVMPQEKLEADDIEGESVVSVSPQVPKVGDTKLEAQINVLQEKLVEAAEEKARVIDTMQKRIDELLAENEELGRPYQQRQYVTVTAGNEPVIVAYYGVALPREKRLGVVKKSAIPIANEEEKDKDRAEWEKNLMPGRLSVDVDMGDEK